MSETRVKELINTLVKKQGALEKIKKQHQEQLELLIKNEKRAESAELAKHLVIDIATKTQVGIGEYVSELVSMALASVFENPYEFKIIFEQKRGNTEARLVFIKNENELDPMLSSGGGAIDIASFALRLAVWSLKKTSRTFILDEPFRNLSMDLQEKAGLMLQELSQKLDVQIIMVSHNPEIIAGADKVITV